MKVLFIRHAQSVANAGGRTIDPASIPITEFGRVQSKVVSEKINEPLDLIIVTPYLRTQQTAEPLCKKYPHCPIEIWQLQEFTYLSPLICQNTSSLERKPLVQQYWATCDPDFVHGPNAESFNQFKNRVEKCISRLNTLKLNSVAIITHEQVIVLIKLLLEIREFAMTDYRNLLINNPVDNTEIFQAEIG